MARYYTAKHNTPAVSTFMKVFGFTLEEATRIKGLLTGKVDLFTSDQAARRDQRSFNAHEGYVLVLEALDEAFGSRTYGVEYIAHKGDTFTVSRGIVYLNVGDPYRTTLMLNLDTGKWSIGCWGDIVERYPNRYE